MVDAAHRDFPGWAGAKPRARGSRSAMFSGSRRSTTAAAAVPALKSLRRRAKRRRRSSFGENCRVHGIRMGPPQSKPWHVIDLMQRDAVRMRVGPSGPPVPVLTSARRDGCSRHAGRCPARADQLSSKSALPLSLCFSDNSGRRTGFRFSWICSRQAPDAISSWRQRMSGLIPAIELDRQAGGEGTPDDQTFERGAGDAARRCAGAQPAAGVRERDRAWPIGQRPEIEREGLIEVKMSHGILI